MTGAARALLPGAAVLAAAFLLYFLTDEVTAQEIAGTYALVVYGAGFALAWVFHRSRAFIALGLLAWLDITVVGRPEASGTLTALGTVVVALIGVLGILRDRGVGSRVGALQVVGIGGVAALGGLLFSDPARVASFAFRPALSPFEGLASEGDRDAAGA